MTLLTPSTARMARRLARGHGRLRWRGRMELGWGGPGVGKGLGRGLHREDPGSCVWFSCSQDQKEG